MAGVTQDGPATAFARNATAWNELDWWRLESRALTGQPRVKRALAFFAPTGAWSELSAGTPKALGCLLVPAHIASLVLPVFGAIVMLAWLFGGTAIAPLGVAGVFAGLAALWQVIGMWRDSRRPDGRILNGARPLALVHLLPSAIALAVAVLALTQSAAEGGWGILGIAADVVVGAFSLRFYRSTQGSAAVTGQLNERRLARAVSEIEETARVGIMTDLQSALALLEQQGLVEPGVVREAKRAPIAGLGRAFAPREETRPEGWRVPGA